MCKEIPEFVYKFIQDTISKIPVIVVGSGSSSTYGISGMWHLSEYLTENVKPSEREENKWSEFKQYLSEGTDLETTLHKVQLSEELEREIVKKTRELILPQDIKIREKIITDEIELSLSTLIKHLSYTANPKIKVVTTNYDRLIEYATDYVTIDYSFGFSGQYIKRFDGRFEKNGSSNTVEILKVHGSLDWFGNPDGEVIALPDSVKYDRNLFPVMITPGRNKYQQTHDDPFRTIISRVDTVFLEASAILIVGFGFNDEHIQPKLMQKMRSSQTPIVIISKELTSKTREFIKANEKSKILGIEKSEYGSNLVFPNQKDIKVQESIWGLDNFLKTFT